MHRSKAAGTGSSPPSISATVRAIGEVRMVGSRSVRLAKRSASAASSASAIAGAIRRKALVGGSRQHQHAGVADRDHIGGARNIGEEADFADQFAGAEFGERQGIPGPVHRERAMQHHKQRVRRIALRDQHFAAHEIPPNHRAEGLRALFGTERSKQREVLGSVSPAKRRIWSVHCYYSSASRALPRASRDWPIRRTLRTYRCRGPSQSAK